MTVLQQWNSNQWDDSDRGSGGRNKLRTNRKFEHNFKLEPYLFQIKDLLVGRSLSCFETVYWLMFILVTNGHLALTVIKISFQSYYYQGYYIISR